MADGQIGNPINAAGGKTCRPISTNLIQARDDDEIVMKWNEDGTILTNLKPKVKARALRQAEDLLGKLETSGVSSIERVERALELASPLSSSSSSS